MFTTLLDHTPPEVLQKIVLYALCSTVSLDHGPPKELHSMLLVCRATNNILSRNSGEFYYEIFRQKFDVEAPVYRLGNSVVHDQAQLELKRRFSALKLFRSPQDSLYHPAIADCLWIAYLMLEDCNLSQKNFKQLLHVGLPSFLDKFLRVRLYEGSEDNNGWPVINEINSLAVTLCWLVCSNAVLSAETPETCEQMVELLKPYVFAAFRYPIFSSPENLFHESDIPNEPVPTVHGPYPPQALLPRTLEYFGKATSIARVPSISVFSTLLYFVRAERVPLEIPPHIASKKWKTRDAASLAGQLGPTLEDIKDFADDCITDFAKFPGVDVGITSSSPLDLILGQPSPYKLGTLTGSWRGSYCVPDLVVYDKWMKDPRPPSKLETPGRKPLYITLKEHYCYDPATVVPCDSPVNGMQHTWLPNNCVWKETLSGVEFSDPDSTFQATYQTFEFGQASSAQPLVDVIITGKIDDRHADAWGGANILGRVRLSDGLMVLAMEMIETGEHRRLRGYVTSSNNLVGRFKPISTGNAPANWEAVFSLCKDNTTRYDPGRQ